MSAAGPISICKFVGTISLGLLTGISTTHTTLTLPALLTLPTAPTAHTTLTYLSSKTRLLCAYLRHLTSFALFSAYLLSPRRFRHPYLLYTSIFAFVSGPGVDLAVGTSGAEPQKKNKGAGESSRDLEAQEGEEINGEQVRQAVERMKVAEGVRACVAGSAFVMGVVGIWGDGA